MNVLIHVTVPVVDHHDHGLAAVVKPVHLHLGRTRLALTRRVVVALLVDARMHVDEPVVVWRNAQRTGKRRDIGRADITVLRAVPVVSVRCLFRGAEPGRYRIVDRHVDHAPNVGLSEVRGTHQRAGLKFRPRLRRDDVDRTARRVLAEQRTLRTTQNLDTLNVKRAHHLAQRIRHVVAVDVQARADWHQIVRRATADTANVECLNAAPVLRRQDQIRNVLRDVLEGDDSLRLHGIGRDGSDRERQILQTLLAPSRRDDNLFEHGSRRSGLRPELCRYCEQSGEQQPRCQCVTILSHGFPSSGWCQKPLASRVVQP